jgi:phospholipase/carboxylesterase
MRTTMTRLRFIAVAGAIGVAELLSSSPVFAAAAESGRLKIPPPGSPTVTATVGLQKLGGKSGLLYLPPSYRANEPLPLLVLLHKATGTPSDWFSGGHPDAPGSYSAYADAGRFIILAPEAPGLSWDGGPKSFGSDYLSINRALEAAFSRCAIDRSRMAIAGFSDGASYALSLGLANGDLFNNVIAFSPGYIVRSIGRGKPLLFIAHGAVDRVLPIDATSRLFVAGLRKNGYNVVFREFSGGHHLSPAISGEAMAWLTKNFRHGR